MPSTEIAVAAHSLVKVYASTTGAVQAVRGVDLDIAAGRTVAVVGPSGSGKSSLLQMLAGLDVPTAGSARILGVDLFALRARARARARARLMTHVYQRPSDNLIAHLTAFEQLARHVLRRSTAAGRVHAALEQLGLWDRRHHLPAELSGGEQQRLAFGRALVAHHGVVFADEPTATLDSHSATGVLEAIEGMAAGGTTVLVATHDPRVLDHVDQIVTLRDGAIASIEVAGSQVSVIDRSGRIQLPPEVQRHFPDREARVRWDDRGDHLVVEPP